jgi:hypothetical protein
MIRKYGAPAVLRRRLDNPVAPGDRPCIAAEVEIKPEEKVGRMVNDVDRTVLISALGLDVAPNQYDDVLVTFVPNTNPPQEFEHLKPVKAPGKLSPAGVVVYWELVVRG